MNKQAFFTILVLLGCCVALMQGLPTNWGGCLCFKWRNSVNMNRVDTEKSVYHEPNGRCSQEEVIVMYGNGNKFCLNPNGKQGRKIKKDFLNKNKTK